MADYKEEMKLTPEEIEAARDEARAIADSAYQAGGEREESKMKNRYRLCRQNETAKRLPDDEAWGVIKNMSEEELIDLFMPHGIKEHISFRFHELLQVFGRKRGGIK